MFITIAVTLKEIMGMVFFKAVHTNVLNISESYVWLLLSKMLNLHPLNLN